jgi:integrase
VVLIATHFLRDGGSSDDKVSFRHHTAPAVRELPTTRPTAGKTGHRRHLWVATRGCGGDAAVDGGLVTVNPATRVRLPRITRVEMRYLNRNPVELELLADTITERYRVMVLTMAWATLRIGEALGLRRSDLDLAEGTLRVANNLVEVAGKLHEGPPKTAAGRRTMSLPASLVSELAHHLDHFAGPVYVFSTADGRPLHAEDWRRLHWRPAVEAGGLSPLRAHDLKHTGVAFLAAAGVDPSEIARRAGHASVAFTYDRYGHLLPEVDKQAALCQARDAAFSETRLDMDRTTSRREMPLKDPARREVPSSSFYLSRRASGRSHRLAVDERSHSLLPGTRHQPRAGFLEHDRVFFGLADLDLVAIDRTQREQGDPLAEGFAAVNEDPDVTKKLAPSELDTMLLGGSDEQRQVEIMCHANSVP